MTQTAVQKLKMALFAAFNGFANKQYKNIDKWSLFIVDDRTDGDHDAAGKLFLWFCQIFVDVKDGDHIEVSLRGGIPQSASVAAWLKRQKANDQFGGTSFLIRKGEEDKLLELATLIGAIVKPGASYRVKAYKYVCPRTVQSLRKLHVVLKSVWGD